MKRMITDFSESLEDYLEAIVILGSERVKSVDLAKHMGVSKASINHAVNHLIQMGLVEKPPYGELSLTEEGVKSAQRILRKHTVVKQFLVEVLGVEEAKAEFEACGIEHNISDDTLSRLEDLIQSQQKKSD